MPHTPIQQFSTSNRVSLGIEISGMTITVLGGGVHLAGQARVLAANESYAVTTRPEDTDVIGYLVEDTSNQELHVFVDEVVLDGLDDTYEFVRGGPYKLLHVLYKVRVPGNTLDIDTLDVTLFHIVENPRDTDTQEEEGE